MTDATKIHVNRVEDEGKVLAFLRRIRPNGASINYEAKAEVWLLKPSERGGRTIGRIVVHSDSDAVAEMMSRAWGTFNGAAK